MPAKPILTILLLVGACSLGPNSPHHSPSQASAAASADMAVVKTELSGISSRIGHLESTTNYDTDVWANRAALLLPMVFAYIMARAHGYERGRMRRLNGKGKRLEP